MAPLILSNLNVVLIRNWTNRIRIWDSVTPNYYLSFTEKCVSKHKRIVNNMTSNEPELKLFSARIGILTLKSASQMQMQRFTFLRVDCMLSYCCYCVIVGTSVRTGNYFITLFAFLPLSHRVSFPISMTASHSSSIRNFCLQTNSGEADSYFTKTHSHSYSWAKISIQCFVMLCLWHSNIFRPIRYFNKYLTIPRRKAASIQKSMEINFFKVFRRLSFFSSWNKYSLNSP